MGRLSVPSILEIAEYGARAFAFEFGAGNRDIFQQKQGDYCGKTGNYHVGLGI